MALHRPHLHYYVLPAGCNMQLFSVFTWFQSTNLLLNVQVSVTTMFSRETYLKQLKYSSINPHLLLNCSPPEGKLWQKHRCADWEGCSPSSCLSFNVSTGRGSLMSNLCYVCVHIKLRFVRQTLHCAREDITQCCCVDSLLRGKAAQKPTSICLCYRDAMSWDRNSPPSPRACSQISYFSLGTCLQNIKPTELEKSDSCLHEITQFHGLFLTSWFKLPIRLIGEKLFQLNPTFPAGYVTSLLLRDGYLKIRICLVTDRNCLDDIMSPVSWLVLWGQYTQNYHGREYLISWKLLDPIAVGCCSTILWHKSESSECRSKERRTMLRNELLKRVNQSRVTILLGHMKVHWSLISPNSSWVGNCPWPPVVLAVDPHRNQSHFYSLWITLMP